MKQLKRLTSILLVLGMVLGLMPLSAFAAEPEDTAEKTFPVKVSDNGGENIYAYRLLGDDTAELTGFLPEVSVADVEIPSTATLNGKVYSVVSIGDSAFIGCTALKSVRFEASIKSIRSHAFAYCTALKSVQFEAPIESIGDGAFLECTELGEVELPASIISIGTAAFLGCAKWETVKLGNSVVSIGENAFALCKNLKSVTIPSSVQTIGAHAFSFGPGGEGKQLVELHYTGTQEQWDGLAKKYDFENINPLLYKPKNFDCAHTVSFDYGGKAEGSTEVVQYGEMVSRPAAPEAEGYRFEDWYTQENGGVKFDFSQPIKADVTVYAHWSEVKPDHTVYFDCGNQAAESTKVVVQHGEKVTPPADPKADGYQFEGWYTQKNGGVKFDFSQEITEDVTVYAHWSKVETNHTVYFNCGGKAEGSTKVVQYGEKVTPPANPKADGYRFEGWYTQENGGVPFDFEQEITKDVTVYAHWSVKPTPTPDPNPDPNPNPDAKEYTLTEKDGTLVRVTVEKNGTTVDITKNVVLKKEGTTQIGRIPAGAMVTVAANAAPEGMVFAQWNISDPALMGNPDVAHTSQTMTFPMPTADVTVEAMYESAENAREAELLGSAAMIGAVGISAVVLAYQAHQLGTELYLKYLLPSGAAIPQNRIQLAELLWRNAGEPVPDVNAAYEDIGLNEEVAQQAAQWAVENELMELPDEEHTEQFKPDEQISYGEAIRAWKKAQQLKTTE